MTSDHLGAACFGSPPPDYDPSGERVEWPVNKVHPLPGFAHPDWAWTSLALGMQYYPVELPPPRMHELRSRADPWVGVYTMRPDAIAQLRLMARHEFGHAGQGRRSSRLYRLVLLSILKGYQGVAALGWQTNRPSAGPWRLISSSWQLTRVLYARLRRIEEASAIALTQIELASSQRKLRTKFRKYFKEERRYSRQEADYYDVTLTSNALRQYGERHGLKAIGLLANRMEESSIELSSGTFLRQLIKADDAVCADAMDKEAEALKYLDVEGMLVQIGGLKLMNELPSPDLTLIQRMDRIGIVLEHHLLIPIPRDEGVNWTSA